MPMSAVTSREPLVLLVDSSNSLRQTQPLLNVLLDGCNTLSEVSGTPAHTNPQPTVEGFLVLSVWFRG